MTLKNSVAVLEPKNGPAKPARRDAVGIEIPVTVHASRTTQGLGRNLPSVHEDTKTVIVLQQGAVVRLTASLTTGETVVLTNRVTGSDVLCRVVNVKSQPGIQHYVDLEFIQRAPGFWGANVAATSAPAASEAPAQPVASAPIPPAPISSPVAVLPPPAPIPMPASFEPPAPVAVPAPPPLLVVPPPPPPPQEPEPIADLPPAAATETLQPAPLAEPVAVPRRATQASLVTPIRAAVDEPSSGSFSSENAASASGSHKTLLAVAAALLLVLGGAAGSYWFFGRQAAAANSRALPQPTSAPPAAPAPDPMVTSSAVAIPATPELNVAAPEPKMDIVLESRPVADAPAARQQPALVSSSRTPAPAAPRINNVPIGQLKAPKAKAITARVDSSEPPPMMVGVVGLGDAGATSALLAADAAGPAPPPGSSAPRAGGQLQPPQLLNSASLVYPSTARMQHVQGVVVLDALVDESGKVTETTVVAGPGPLLMAAQESVRSWRYKPAQLNGKPIAVHTRVSVRFSLQ